ncbi:STAS domain-containing protein [Nocardiopsis metallicus]|uniref:Anti-sigma B factor antagonist n=1 Tax=Nocardiopsis metallicus TaxID=179819 RepID=A0A840WSI0_9ACTN|nr:STAS domain-containing protein [Nocardiopsis metallicus]MBB5493088.1 anti-sigma B factor antagonist [Nocardiopsis metallicus]
MAVLDPDQERFRCDGMSVVYLKGEIDIATAEGVYASLASAVVENCTVVDLTAVDFIDASGVNALVGALRVAAGAQHHLLVASPPRQLRRILDVLDLHGLLPTHADAETARASHTAHAMH